MRVSECVCVCVRVSVCERASELRLNAGFDSSFDVN